MVKSNLMFLTILYKCMCSLPTLHFSCGACSSLFTKPPAPTITKPWFSNIFNGITSISNPNSLTTPPIYSFRSNGSQFCSIISYFFLNFLQRTNIIRSQNTIIKAPILKKNQLLWKTRPKIKIYQIKLESLSLIRPKLKL